GERWPSPYLVLVDIELDTLSLCQPGKKASAAGVSVTNVLELGDKLSRNKKCPKAWMGPQFLSFMSVAPSVGLFFVLARLPIY
ncbi:hypothetical protein FRX31_005676, partial [Thalictrum thalictroides]